MGRTMKIDLYTKVVLTTIATCLLVLVFRDAPVVTTARATEGDKPMHVISIRSMAASTVQPCL
jgi:hypothetical protein